MRFYESSTASISLFYLAHSPRWLAAAILLTATTWSSIASATDQSLATIRARPADLATVGIAVNGTGVKVGNIDDNIFLAHPAFPVGTSVTDFSGGGLVGLGDMHSTNSSSVIVGAGGGVTGIAPGAQLDVANVFNAGVLSAEGVAKAIDTHGAAGRNIISMSLGGNSFGTTIDGNSTFTKFLDWAVSEYNITFIKSAGNNGKTGSTTITPPGDAYNIITVGATGIAGGLDNGDYSRVASFSSEGRTTDLRNKPDIVAPGVNIDMAAVGGGLHKDDGTSFAAPHVAGGAVLLKDFADGVANHSLDHRVFKSILLNSADHSVKQKDGTKWEPTLPGIDPLDDQAGTGQLDMVNAFINFKPGKTVNPANTNPIAWDLNTVAANATVDYVINKQLVSGSTLAATIVWDREITRTEVGNDELYLNDTYTVGNFANLNLYLVDSMGVELNLLDALGRSSQSHSPVDSVEHIYFQLPKQDTYTLRIANWSGFDEEFAFSLLAVAVPEPGTVVMLLSAMGMVLVLGQHRRGQQRS